MTPTDTLTIHTEKTRETNNTDKCTTVGDQREIETTALKVVVADKMGIMAPMTGMEGMVIITGTPEIMYQVSHQAHHEDLVLIRVPAEVTVHPEVTIQDEASAQQDLVVQVLLGSIGKESAVQVLIESTITPLCLKETER